MSQFIGDSHGNVDDIFMGLQVCKESIHRRKDLSKKFYRIKNLEKLFQEYSLGYINAYKKQKVYKIWSQKTPEIRKIKIIMF